MAIDSAEKRRSASGVAFLPLGPGVTPTSPVTALWRAAVAWSYFFLGVAPGDVPTMICLTDLAIASPTVTGVDVQSPTVTDVNVVAC